MDVDEVILTVTISACVIVPGSVSRITLPLIIILL